jgi:sensor histidine kinase regulating citrate/malate metabolism
MEGFSMETKKRRFTIEKKMYLFIFAMIFFAVASVCLFSYIINVSQIDGYFKQLTLDNAQNVASLIDADFYKELRTIAESEEYQAIRDQAEEEDDDELVIEYLQEQGMR